MKDLSKITEADILAVLQDDFKREGIIGDWEIFEIYIKSDFIPFGVKIRRKYLDNEINFNSDGYKYRDLFINQHNTAHYLKLKELGYKTIFDI